MCCGSVSFLLCAFGVFGCPFRSVRVRPLGGCGPGRFLPPLVARLFRVCRRCAVFFFPRRCAVRGVLGWSVRPFWRFRFLLRRSLGARRCWRCALLGGFRSGGPAPGSGRSRARVPRLGFGVRRSLRRWRLVGGVLWLLSFRCPWCLAAPPLAVFARWRVARSLSGWLALLAAGLCCALARVARVAVSRLRAAASVASAVPLGRFARRSVGLRALSRRSACPSPRLSGRSRVGALRCVCGGPPRRLPRPACAGFAGRVVCGVSFARRRWRGVAPRRLVWVARVGLWPAWRGLAGGGGAPAGPAPLSVVAAAWGFCPRWRSRASGFAAAGPSARWRFAPRAGAPRPAPGFSASFLVAPLRGALPEEMMK